MFELTAALPPPFLSRFLREAKLLHTLLASLIENISLPRRAYQVFTRDTL